VLAVVTATAVGLMAWAAVGLADNPSGCDFAANGTSESCAGPLSGSTFAGGDGNLLTNPTTFGTTDWQNVAGRNTGIDLTSGQGDNSFGGGTKEDDANVTVVSGSIPNNKSDLTRFYEASEFANGSNFLYLAWERSNTLGSANMDFEINQKTQPDLTTPGANTLNRTAGDLLVTFDFTNGGGKPTLGLLTWVTTGSSSQCFSSNSLPCWGNHVTLNGTNSVGAVNNLDAVTDPFLPGTSNIDVNRFGETAINLTAAGVFPPGTCEAFGSAFLKSRSSASFPAEVKDFVAPVSVNISNCGHVTVHKVTENGDGTFGYTTTGGLSPATFSMSNGGSQSFTSTGQATGNVAPGPYSVTESTVPSSWTLRLLTCTTTGSGTSASTNLATATVSITMAPGGNVDCTYTNHTKLSPTIATTLSESTGSIGDSVHDSATLTGATSNAGGTVTYTVYTNDTCTANPQDAGTVNVTSGSVPDSNAITFNSAGTFYWQAVYSGDANNNGATSACTSEKLVIAKNNPSITTKLSESTGLVGDMVSDSATLMGATADAGGTVKYTVYTDSACTQDPQDAGTKTVTNGSVPDSNAITFNTAGTFYWQAIYSGDANNNIAISDCTTEQLIINKLPSTISTAQAWYPQDTAIIDHGGGTVAFTLYKNDPTCTNAGAVVYGPDQEEVPGSAPFEASTNNTTFFVIAVASSDTYYWKAAYASGDAAHKDVTSSCQESTGFSSLDNGSPVTSP
jgi:hypothetical protein